MPRLSLLLPVLLGLSLTACFGSDKEDEDDDDDDASSDGGGWDLGGSEDSGFTGDGGTGDGGGGDGGTGDGGTGDGGTDSGSSGDGGTGGDTPYDGAWSGMLELGAYLKGEPFGACIDSSAELEITDAASTSVLACTWEDGPLAGYSTELELDLSVRDGGSVEGSGDLDLAGLPVSTELSGEAAPRALYIEVTGFLEEGGVPLEVDGTIEMSR